MLTYSIKHINYDSYIIKLYNFQNLLTEDRFDILQKYMYYHQLI